MKTLSVSEAEMKLSALFEGLRVTDEEVLFAICPFSCPSPK